MSELKRYQFPGPIDWRETPASKWMDTEAVLQYLASLGAAHKAELERAKEDAAESDAKIRDILCVLLSNLPYSQVEAIRTKCEEATRTRLQAERGKDGVKDGD